MAKIVEQIAGYADMTAEQKLAALEALEAPETGGGDGAEVTKLKRQLSQANSEAADFKRQLQAKMTEQEKKDAAAAEEQKKILLELETLRKEKTVAGYKASYLSMGYDDALAGETAQALADGDMNKVFANQRSFQEAQTKSVLAGAIKTTPTPPGGNPGATVTQAQFDAMGYEARAKLHKESPDLYNELAGNKES